MVFAKIRLNFHLASLSGLSLAAALSGCQDNSGNTIAELSASEEAQAFVILAISAGNRPIVEARSAQQATASQTNPKSTSSTDCYSSGNFEQTTIYSYVPQYFSGEWQLANGEDISFNECLHVFSPTDEYYRDGRYQEGGSVQSNDELELEENYFIVAGDDSKPLIYEVKEDGFRYSEQTRGRFEEHEVSGETRIHLIRQYFSSEFDYDAAGSSNDFSYTIDYGRPDASLTIELDSPGIRSISGFIGLSSNNCPQGVAGQLETLDALGYGDYAHPVAGSLKLDSSRYSLTLNFNADGSVSVLDDSGNSELITLSEMLYPNARVTACSSPRY